MLLQRRKNMPTLKKRLICKAIYQAGEARLIILFSYHYRIFTAQFVSFLLKIILLFRIIFVHLRLKSYQQFCKVWKIMYLTSI